MSTLFLEAFGQLSGAATINSLEEDLYSVFSERAELMLWAGASSGRPLLWAMEEAELTAGADPWRIGWAQVGLDVGPIEARGPRVIRRSGWYESPTRRRSTNPVLALIPLVQCLNDSILRFGAVELSGFQVTASRLDAGAGDCRRHLVSVLNWFNTGDKTRSHAIVAFDQGLLGRHDVSKLVTSLQRRNTGRFDFRSVVDVPEECMIKVSTGTHFYPVTSKSDQGVFVALPEWTPSAAGWVLASVIDAASTIEPGANGFVVRVTRV